LKKKVEKKEMKKKFKSEKNKLDTFSSNKNFDESPRRINSFQFNGVPCDSFVLNYVYFQ